jgi:hypothetical protein
VREEGYEVEVTERYKSSSCAAGIPKTAITASPMNYSALRRPLAATPGLIQRALSSSPEDDP